MSSPADDGLDEAELFQVTLTVIFNGVSMSGCRDVYTSLLPLMRQSLRPECDSASYELDFSPLES